MPKPRRIPAFSLSSELNKDIDIDKEPVRFGKHIGKTPTQIAEEDPSYLIWAYETFTTQKPCSKDLYEACLLDEADASYDPIDGHLKFRK